MKDDEGLEGYEKFFKAVKSSGKRPNRQTPRASPTAVRHVHGPEGILDTWIQQVRGLLLKSLLQIFGKSCSRYRRIGTSGSATSRPRAVRAHSHHLRSTHHVAPFSIHSMAFGLLRSSSLKCNHARAVNTGAMISMIPTSAAIKLGSMFIVPASSSAGIRRIS